MLKFIQLKVQFDQNLTIYIILRVSVNTIKNLINNVIESLQLLSYFNGGFYNLPLIFYPLSHA